MKLQTLKTNLLENRLPDSFMIFVCSENFFIADPYIEMICNKSGKEKRLISKVLKNHYSLLLVNKKEELKDLRKRGLYLIIMGVVSFIIYLFWLWACMSSGPSPATYPSAL